ncbi:MAG: signal peptidase II [Eubacteriales bacterium]|nr:signal peptidase II [Eubacteriales bacterium]
MEKKRKIFLWVYLAGMAVLVFLDQITKIAAENKLYNKKAFVIIDGFFELSYLRNSGAAWGMLSGKRIFFLLITLFMLGVITYAVIKMPAVKKMIPLECVCILLGAGAAGNFIDRLVFGYVRDFIYFKAINFPVFNVADSYVTVAEILFIILIFFVYDEADFDFLKFNNKKDDK